MYSFDDQNGVYSLDAKHNFFVYKLEALKAVQYGLSACHLFVLKCNLNEHESDLTVAMDKLTVIAKTLSELPKIIATGSHECVIASPSFAILDHFKKLDKIKESYKAQSENRALKDNFEICLELHNNLIQDFSIPAHTTLNAAKFPPIALENLPKFLDCFLMYTLNMQDMISPLVGRGYIAYNRLNIDISDEEQELNFYRQKFDFVASNLGQLENTINSVMQLVDFIRNEEITDQDISKMIKHATECKKQAEISNSANFASLLMI